MSTRQPIWLLSGGIGSGKSTVRKMLADRGVATIDADSIGHEVLTPGGPAEDEVLQVWPEVCGVDGIDRSRLASVVFDDPRALERLESITHPHIFRILQRRLAESGRPTVVEIPLLVQPLAEQLPRMVVDASDSVRLARAIARGQSAPDVRARMASQPHRSEWLAGADVVIPNHGDLIELEATVDLIADQILDRSRSA